MRQEDSLRLVFETRGTPSLSSGIAVCPRHTVCTSAHERFRGRTDVSRSEIAMPSSPDVESLRTSVFAELESLRGRVFELERKVADGTGHAININQLPVAASSTDIGRNGSISLQRQEGPEEETEDAGELAQPAGSDR